MNNSSNFGPNFLWNWRKLKEIELECTVSTIDLIFFIKVNEQKLKKNRELEGSFCKLIALASFKI